METELKPGLLNIDVTNGCIEDDECLELGATKQEVGVYKAFKDIIFNQTEIDYFSCFVVGPYTALANFTGKKPSYDLMRKTLARLKKDGKFTPGFGGKLSDGVQYAVEDFNKVFKTKIKYKNIYLNGGNIIEAIKSGSPISTGIKYGKDYFTDEQTDGVIGNQVGSITGNAGHCISIVKVNTTDQKLGTQIKFCENYQGKLTYNIIYCNFDNFRSLFFNSGFSYYV